MLARARAFAALAFVFAPGVVALHKPLCKGPEYRIVGGCDARYVDLSSSFVVLVITMDGGKTWNWRGCSGNLITPTIVLSAAHCDHENLLGVIVNTTALSKGGGSVFRDVKRRIPHSAWDGTGRQSDFLIIELAEPVPDRFAPLQIPLASPEYMARIPASATFVACGFGAESSSGTLTDHLTCVSIPYRPSCGTEYGDRYDPATMICAGTTDADACQGDSGGPLYHKTEDGKWTLVGVTSWGWGCAVVETPGVWARVSSALGWLKGHGVQDFKVRDGAVLGNTGAAPVAGTTTSRDPFAPVPRHDREGDIVEMHNRLRCLHAPKGDARWGGNLTWSAELAMQAKGKEKVLSLLASEVMFLQHDYGLGGSLLGVIQEEYRDGIYETVEARGERVAPDRAMFDSLPPWVWARMRQYIDMTWASATEVRLEMSEEELWESLNSGRMLRKITDDPEHAKACGLELSAVSPSKTVVNVNDQDAGDIKDAASCDAAPGLLLALSVGTAVATA